MPTRNGHRYLEREWTSTGKLEGTASRSVELDRRSTHRVAVEARVIYEGEHCSHGEGRLVELSKEGCRIIGSRPVPGGSILTLSIKFSDGQPPLRLCAATVCWAASNTFGVRFAELTDSERQRLQQMIWRFATRKGESEGHTEYRFA